MNSNYYLQSSSDKLVDSPFAKMAPHFSATSSRLGFPPIPFNADVVYSDIHHEAVSILGLDSPDSDFVSARIRHLDAVARTSRLAYRMDWRSTLKNTFNSSTIFDRFFGFSATTTNSDVAINGLVDSRPSGAILNWNFTVFSSGSSINFIAQGGYNDTFEFTVNQGNVGVFTLGNSGYKMVFRNNMAGGDSMTGQINIRWPYVGNIIPIKDSILSNSAFLDALTINDPLLLNYLKQDSAPEDVIAAFLLAVDSH